VLLAILWIRSRISVTRIPADPGYWYILDGDRKGVLSLLVGDPYFHVVARLLAWVTSWFPLVWQAVVLAALVHFVWAACALVVAHVVNAETASRWMGSFAGLLLVTAPHAAESSLGNIGNVKWPLLAATMLLCSSPRVIRAQTVAIMVLLAVTGLTQPLTLLNVIPIAFLLTRGRLSWSISAKLLAPIVITLTIQVVRVGLTAATSGQSAKVARPWDGMGLFWWSGLVGPIAVSILAMLLAVIFRMRLTQFFEFAMILAVLAVATSIVSYLMGGIGDRYFVVPMTLALIAATLVIGSLPNRQPFAGKVVVLAALSMLLVPTAKWFSASWYLTSGPTWSSEVRRVTDICTDLQRSTVDLSVSPDATNELECEYVLSG
jgi:hypothetical protein